MNLSGLECIDPERFLRNLREVEQSLPLERVDPKIRTLRRKDMQSLGHRRQYALFCMGVQKMLGTKVWFSDVEEQDYDFLIIWKLDGETTYTKVQMKELVPGELNPDTSLEQEIAKLCKYVSSEDLVVAIYLNRRIRLEPHKIKLPKLSIGELYLFGSLKEGSKNWMLWGDLLKEPKVYEYGYPE